jgi:ABC-type phosphate/phosphonate transport system permease subunit
MNYLKITKYLYLIIGFVMLYAAIMKWDAPEIPWLELILSGTAFFTFFFRNRFYKKFQDRKNQSNQNNP